MPDYNTQQVFSEISNEWVGAMRLGDSLEFIRLIFAADHGARLDRPNRFLFHLPLLEANFDLPHVSFTDGSLHFEGTLNKGRFSGMVWEVHEAHSIQEECKRARTGTFALQAVQVLPPDTYRKVIGQYQVVDREIVLGQYDRETQQLYFYVDGEDVVRLYPLESGRFYSEHCETITIHANAKLLTWQADGESPIDAPRVNWYREQVLAIPVGDHVIAGTLLLPLDEGPHPAVMLCHHADTHQRDYYRLFAEPFVRRGTAAFIYDKRGRGQSTGIPLFSEIFELADDAYGVFRFLQSHPAIRPGAIGIWGISNGAWVGALTASRVGDAAFVIGASVAGVTPARQEQIRRVNVIRELGASPRAAALIDQLWGRLFKFYVEGEWSVELEQVLRQVYEDEELQRLPKHPDHGPGLQPVPPTRPIEQLKNEYGRAWPDGGFDVAAVYADLKCPILCVWGEQDNVLPLEEGIERVKRALAESHHPSYRLHVAPNATHKLYTVSPEPQGILAETMHTHLHNVSLTPGIRNLMADWAVSIGGEQYIVSG